MTEKTKIKLVVLFLSLLIVAATVASICIAACGVGLVFALNDERTAYIVADMDSSGADAVTIPATYNGLPVTSIGDRAFEGCSSLTSVTIGSNVASIGRWAFEDCNNLTSITIPASVASVGWGAFSDCSNLTGVYISDTAAWCALKFDNESANPLYYAGNLYLNGELVTELVLPEGVTGISSYAFYNCRNLASVTISDGAVSIGERSFYGCSDLALITIPDSVTSIGELAFYDCNALTGVFISDLAAWCTIDFGAYLNDNPLYYAGNLYLHGELVTELIIPEGVTSISDGAFAGCSSLTEITISESVTNIGSSAFRECSGLTSVTVPDSVTSIGWSAFRECGRLTSVTFENMEGWWRAETSTATSGTSISSSALANPSTAATYLNSTYCDYHWRCS